MARRLGYVDAADAIKRHCRGSVERLLIVGALARIQEGHPKGVVTVQCGQGGVAAFKLQEASALNSFDALVSTLAELQSTANSQTWIGKAFQPPPRSRSIAPQLAKLHRVQNNLAAMNKALAPPKPTRDEVRARVREVVADVMAKALAAQKAGTITGLEVIRLEAESLHALAAI